MLPLGLDLMQERANAFFFSSVRRNPEHAADPTRLQCGPR
jgi:hypothetical protein